MAGYPDWTRPKGWNVTGLGAMGTNPWSLTVGDNLRFYGEGTGDGSNDYIRDETPTPTTVGTACEHNPSGWPLGTVGVYHGGKHYRITPDISGSPVTLTCREISGGIAWTATEG